MRNALTVVVAPRLLHAYLAKDICRLLGREDPGHSILQGCLDGRLDSKHIEKATV